MSKLALDKFAGWVYGCYQYQPDESMDLCGMSGYSGMPSPLAKNHVEDGADQAHQRWAINRR